MANQSKIRVLLADDEPLLRECLVSLLVREPDIQVIGEAANGQAAVEWARQLKPDVIIMDIRMPKLSGVEATKAILAADPSIRVIGHSMQAELYANAMREAGAATCLSKMGATDLLLAAIRNGAGCQSTDGNHRGGIDHATRPH